MQQLKDLLLECVEFKLRLDRQEYGYCFRWSCPWTLFHEEQMRSQMTGVSSTNSFVVQRIWPMLCKGTSENWIIVEKEVVQLIQEPPDPEPLTETDFYSELSSLSL